MRSFVLAVSAVLLVASCTDDPEPIEPRPSGSQKPAAPDMPREAKANSPAGAANFVSYWVEVSNFAAHTGDTSELEQISDERCKGCRVYMELYEDTYAAGGYFKGSEWRLSNVEVKPGKSEHLIFAHVDAPTGTFKRSSSARVERGNQEDSDLVFGVSFVDGRWRLTQLGLKSQVNK